ncbi:hypothetical protein E0G74_01075 [Salmonella enterica]|nr:hypothetical protein [Salmonella enterica]ECB1886259.1 hypothetical protein [Salmonella enterica subsp. enterica serovar Mississippi]
MKESITQKVVMNTTVSHTTTIQTQTVVSQEMGIEQELIKSVHTPMSHGGHNLPPLSPDMDALPKP